MKLKYEHMSKPVGVCKRGSKNNSKANENMLSILSLLLALSPLSFAKELEITRIAGNKIELKLSCNKITSELNALKTWTSTVDGRNCNLPTVLTVTEGLCSADITECLPRRVAKYHGIIFQIGGPNCFNTALVFAGLLPALRTSARSEFAEFMNSPLCKLVPPDDRQKPGDIVAIRFPSLSARSKNKNYQEWHAFIYVSDEMSFSKNGENKEDPYILTSTKSVFNEYMNQTDPPRCLPKDRDPSARLFTSNDLPTCFDVIRCETMANFMAQLNAKKYSDLVKIKTNLDHADCMEEQLFSSTSSFDQPLADQLKDVFIGLEAYLAQNAPKFERAKQDQKGAVLFTILAARLRSMSEHFTNFREDGSDSDVNKAISSLIDKSLADLGTSSREGEVFRTTDEHGKNIVCTYGKGSECVNPVPYTDEENEEDRRRTQEDQERRPPQSDQP